MGIVERKFAFIGFGNVARAFARILNERRDKLARDFSLSWKTFGIATGKHGCITASQPIDLMQAAEVIDRGGKLTDLDGCQPRDNALEVLGYSGADLVFETTPLNSSNGQPAIDYIRSALAARCDVVSANKGPVAFAYSELKELAGRFGVQYRFEGSVMDGTPIFNLVESCLPGTTVLGFEGVLNSTSNLILTLMEEGRSFSDALTEAQRVGVAEADPDQDIDGLDSLVKAKALSNVLMNAEFLPTKVNRSGIRSITVAELAAAQADRNCIRPLVRAWRSSGELSIEIGPERVSTTSLFAAATGTSNVLILKTDLMGDLAIFEKDPCLTQTAYSLLSDLLSIHTSRR